MKSNNTEKSKTSVKIKQLAQRHSPLKIDRWISALNAARSRDNPNRRALYELYLSASLDTKLASVMQRIELACQKTKIRYYEEGKSEEQLAEINEFLSNYKILDLIRFIIESRWYGFSLVEFSFDSKKLSNIVLYPREYVCPEFGKIMIDGMQGGESVLYEEEPYNRYIIAIGDTEDLGIINNVIPIIASKRDSFADWAEASERVGAPAIVGQYLAEAENAFKEMDEQLQDLGGRGTITIPTGASVNYLNADVKVELFKEAIDLANSQIAQMFLLQDMTTENGSSRSQAEVHLEGEEMLIQGYKTLVERVFNSQVKDILQYHGYDLSKGSFKYDYSVQYELSDTLEILKTLSPIADFDLQELSKKFGLELSPKQQPIQQPTPATGDKPQTKNKRYNLSCCSDPNCKSNQLKRSLMLKLSQGDEDLLRKVFEAKGDLSFDGETYKTTAKILTEGFSLGWSRKSEKYSTDAQTTRDLMEFNLHRFALSKDTAVVAELNKLLKETDGFGAFSEKAGAILGDFNKVYLQTEYNLARSVAQATQSHYDNIENAEQFPYVEYQTVGDERVRAAHRELDGLIFKVTEVGALTPPNGYGCRCELVPRSQSEFESSGKSLSNESDALDALSEEEYAKMESTGFIVNRTETSEVFTAKQFYTQVKEGNLSYKDFGLEKYKDISAKSEDFIPGPLTKQQQNDWFDKKRSKSQTDTANLLDYSERVLTLDRDVMLTTDIQSNAITQMEKVLEKPDEVFLTKEGKAYTVKYVKYFKTNPLILEVVFNKARGGVIKKLYSATKSDETRTGLLIKAPK